MASRSVASLLIKAALRDIISCPKAVINKTATEDKAEAVPKHGAWQPPDPPRVITPGFLPRGATFYVIFLFRLQQHNLELAERSPGWSTGHRPQPSCNNPGRPGPDVTRVLGPRDVFPDADAASRALRSHPVPTGRMSLWGAGAWRGLKFGP